jgi:hypothetical protein
VFHYTHKLFPAEVPKFSQLYMYDSAEATWRRAERDPDLDPEMLQELADALGGLGNPYTHGYRRIRYIFGDALPARAGAPSFTLGFAAAEAGDLRRYTAPAAAEVAACFQSRDGRPPTSRDIVVWPLDRPAVRVCEWNDQVDPLTYPLLAPCGDPGWTENLRHQGRLTPQRNHVTCAQF